MSTKCVGSFLFKMVGRRFQLGQYTTQAIMSPPRLQQQSLNFLILWLDPVLLLELTTLQSIKCYSANKHPLVTRDRISRLDMLRRNGFWYGTDYGTGIEQKQIICILVHPNAVGILWDIVMPRNNYRQWELGQTKIQFLSILHPWGIIMDKAICTWKSVAPPLSATCLGFTRRQKYILLISAASTSIGINLV